MKKILFFLILALFLTGCSSTKEKEITFWTLQMGDFALYINEVIEKYEASQAKFKEKIDKVKPVAKNVAIACGVALAVNALLSSRKNKENK